MAAAGAFDPDPCWFRLSMELRLRWWRETDYGRKPPSDELREMLKREGWNLENYVADNE